MRNFIPLVALFLLLGIEKSGFSQTNDFKVVGYFPNWANMNYDIDNLDCSKLTHINWAFQNPDASGNLVESNNGLTKLVEKAHASNVKVLISIGGGAASYGTTMNTYFNLISTSEKRAGFIHKIAMYIDKYKLQGVDVDLEGSAINSNYGAFIQQLCDSLRPKGLLITAALNGGATDGLKNSTIPLFDFINIMSYDFSGQWDPNSVRHHSLYEDAVTGVEGWAARGTKTEQLIVGVPFYCHAFNALVSWDYKNYNEIIVKWPDAFLHDTIGNAIYYNGIETIKKKTILALERAGGIMIWALSYDVYNEYSLLKAIDDARKSYNPEDKAPVMSFLSPAGDATIASNSFEFTAFANDSDGVFKETAVTVNGILMATSKEDTATFVIENLSDGKYELKITGTDHQYRSGSASMNLTVSGATRNAFNHTKNTIPGTIEVENYDAGANGLTFKDNDVANQGKSYRSDAVDIETCSDKTGGYNVGYIGAGEWLEYTVDVAETATYRVVSRVASSNSNKKFHVECDGVNVSGSITVPGTGGWQTWKDVTSERFILEAGEHIIRLAFDTDGFNFNNFKIEKTVPLGVAEVTKELKMKVYPNPASDFVYIESDGKTKASVEFYDSIGRLVSSPVFEHRAKRFEVDIQELKAGMYNMVISTSKGKTCYQLMKK